MEANNEVKQDSFVGTDSEEKIFESLFEKNVLPDEKIKGENIKFLQQKGFQIALMKEKNIHEKLDSCFDKSREAAKEKDSKWAALYERFVFRLDTKIAFIQEEVLKLKDKEKQHDTKLEELEGEKKQISAEIEKIKLDLISIRSQFSVSKKGIGEKLVADVENELTRVVKLQRNLYDETKGIHEDRYNNTKNSLNALIEKLHQLRAFYSERYELLHIKIRTLSESGINERVANILIGLGTATAGVAGYFFAIFSAKSNYSSQDALYYLLKNALDTINRSGHPVLLKFAYLLGGLLLITGFSWLMDWFIKKKTFFSSSKQKEGGTHYFASDFKMEGVSYNYKTQSKTWLLLWLRIAPLALIVGISIIFLSQGGTIMKDTNALSASTEGLLIGTLLSMGLAAVIYIYIVKIIEPRLESTEVIPKRKKNWELVIVVCLFFIVILSFVFYKDSSISDQFPASPFSIVGFFGASIITAFSFAYGIRYFWLLESISQVEGIIYQIDKAIQYYSVPVQTPLEIDFNQNLDELMSCLVNNLRKKGQLLKNISQKDTLTQVSQESKGNTIGRVIKIFKPGAFINNFEEADLFEILEWEIEYFPEYAEQLKITGSICRDKKRQLTEIEIKIRDLILEKKKTLESIASEINGLREKESKLTALQLRAQIACEERIIAQEKLLEKDIVHIQDGFDLGIAYTSQINLN